jgi:hypothetical protein
MNQPERAASPRLDEYGGAVGIDTLRLTVSGPDARALTQALATLPDFAGVPTRVEVDRESRPATSDWLARWLPATTRNLRVEWGTDALLWHRETVVLARCPSFAADPLGLTRFIAGLDIHLASVCSPFSQDWMDAGYRADGFSDGHLPHGWACLFKGAGHDRLVSRRWLDHGPWRLTRYPDDVSLVQFHDLTADSPTALAQATPGHVRMGISRTGGFLQTEYVYHTVLSGVYDPNSRTYRIPVAVRELSQTEMLDACALRAEKRHDPSTPIDTMGFTFVMGPEEAEPYVHELWLRELACWAVVDGYDIRIDDNSPPATSR